MPFFFTLFFSLILSENVLTFLCTERNERLLNNTSDGIYLEILKDY